MPYCQLTHEQRCRNEALNASGITQTEIAERTSVSQSTISRELSRNAPESAACGYHADSAQAKAVLRRRHPPPRIKPSVWREAERLLKDGLSYLCWLHRDLKRQGPRIVAVTALDPMSGPPA